MDLWVYYRLFIILYVSTIYIKLINLNNKKKKNVHSWILIYFEVLLIILKLDTSENVNGDEYDLLKWVNTHSADW